MAKRKKANWTPEMVANQIAEDFASAGWDVIKGKDGGILEDGGMLWLCREGASFLVKVGCC